jgi:hypothetical protein
VRGYVHFGQKMKEHFEVEENAAFGGLSLA